MVVSMADHPRSRGVYGGRINVIFDWRGIIPARAGFTERHFTPRSWEWDHPRSRGVYPFRVVRSCRVLRIIPARAGFTVVVMHRWGNYGDHPRSRGVYAHHRDPAGIHGGSSPLARGLLVNVSHPRLEIGIIPARAGFTNP